MYTKRGIFNAYNTYEYKLDNATCNLKLSSEPSDISFLLQSMKFPRFPEEEQKMFRIIFGEAFFKILDGST